MHGHLEAVAGAAGIEPAGQRALGHQPQRIRAPLRAAHLVSLRGRRHLLQRRLQGAQHHCAHLGGQPCPQHHHAVIVHPRAQRAARQAHLLGVRLRLPVRLPPRPHQPLHLRAGGAAGDGDQARLIVGAGHPRKGAYDGVGKPAAGHGRGEVVELGQRGGDAQLFAGGAEVEAGAPVEPVGTGAEALPAMLAVELAEVTKQLVGGGLDACRQLGDAVPEQVQVGRRLRVGRRCARAFGSGGCSLAPGATGMAVTVAAGCSVVDNSGHAAGVAWRGRVMVSGAMPAWYTRFSTPPCWPVDGPFTRFGLFKAEHRGAGPERALKAEMRAESAGSETWRNQARNTMSTPSGLQPGFFYFFWTFGVSRPPAGSPRTSSASSSSAPTENPALIHAHRWGGMKATLLAAIHVRVTTGHWCTSWPASPPER